MTTAYWKSALVGSERSARSPTITRGELDREMARPNLDPEIRSGELQVDYSPSRRSVRSMWTMSLDRRAWAG